MSRPDQHQIGVRHVRTAQSSIFCQNGSSYLLDKSYIFLRSFEIIQILKIFISIYENTCNYGKHIIFIYVHFYVYEKHTESYMFIPQHRLPLSTIPITPS